ncbi:hypothetical protein FA048_04205 [Pedobacter polaris]|uniref:Uncharacterized protein n=2 Tax=Pedobacter polaris TaxID=2571273 RepID=A0A4U1CZK4_9SPHI|nr:hypothetical protein FA048_04205 [Pedobacter polaris]
MLVSLMIMSYATPGFSQAKKPTIMVVPSDVWCNQNGYMKAFNNQGTIEKVPDYKRAFQENSDLLAMISKINGLMADRGFPLKNMESVVKTLESESAENAMLSSKNGGGITESPIDKLKKTAKADIIMQLTFEVLKVGPKKSVRFTLQGIDAYTDKEIATAQGTGNQSFSADVAVLLEEAIIDKIDNFNIGLQRHFDDLFANGREIIVRVKKFDTWAGDLEKEYNGEELGTLIENWMKANTVKGRFSTSESTENMLLFEQVRIPLYDSSGNAIDARGFARNLQKFLSAAPFSIVNKLMTKGLGQAVIVLGDK